MAEAPKSDEDTALGATLTAHTSGGPTAVRESAPRTTIGRYRVISRLGAGGMGTVYVAEDPDLDRKVAIKILHATSDTSSARLGREARALAKLRHPNVVTIHEVGRDGSDEFVAMELVDGVTLREWQQTPHTFGEKLDVLGQAARGLVAAHAVGLVHRDFKPDNVMVGANGRVQVLDFGLAKTAADSIDPDATAPTKPIALDELTRTGAVVGTPAYMAPEQFAGEPTDARTDQFAFAVVTFELVNGFRPFAGVTYETLADAVMAGKRSTQTRPSDVPARIQTALDRALSIAPADRFPTLEAFIAELVATPPPVPPKRRRLALALAGALVVGGAVLVATAKHDHPIAAPADPLQAIFATSRLPEPLAAPLPNDPYKVTIHRLSNGLTVYISTNRKSPRISTTLLVRAGSRDAPTSAVSHLVEHMLGKGTDKVGTTDFAKESPHLDKLKALYQARDRATTDTERASLLAQIDTENVEASRFAIPSETETAQALLGVTNVHASTSYDTSMLSADVPSNKLGQWAELLGERWRNPVMRLFHSEVGLVFSEIQQERSHAGSGWYAMLDAMNAALFPNHPYSNPIGGSYKDIAAEPYTQSETFLHTYFVPNNAALFLAGDVDANQAIPVLEHALAGWKPQPLPARDEHEAAMPTGSTTTRVNGMQPGRVFGYRAPALGSPDELVMAMIGELLRHLGDPERGRMTVWQQPLVAGSMLSLVISAQTGAMVDEAVKTTEADVQALRDGTMSEATFEAMRTNFVNAFDFGHESNDQRVYWMSSAYQAGHAWRDMLGLRDRAAAVTKQDIARVAKTYLAAPLAVIEIDPAAPKPPDMAPPSITPLALADHATSAFVRDLLAEETVEIPPHFVTEGRDYEVRDTPAGLLVATRNTDDRFYSTQIHWNVTERELPLVCTALRVLEGTTNAVRRERWYAMGQIVQTTCLDSGVELSLYGADTQFDATWQDAWDWLLGPDITDGEAAAEIADLIANEHHEASLAYALSDLAAYGARSEYLTAPTHAQIRAMTTSSARAILAKLAALPHTTNYYGPREITTLPVAAKATAPITAKPRAFGPPRTLVFDRSEPTAHAEIRISLGLLAPAKKALATTMARYYAVVLDERIRSGRGEGFYNSATLDTPTDPREPTSLVITLDTAPKQVAALVALVLGIARSPVDGKQFERARSDVEQSIRSNWISPRQVPYEVVKWRRLGLTDDPRRDQFDRLVRMRPDELVAQFAQVAHAPTFITIIGDAKQIDTAKLGPIQTVTMKDLFAP
ncbi:MAG: protein kinase [Kofleriaceae bacterium]